MKFKKQVTYKVRVYAEKKGSVYQAFSLEYGLAAQAPTMHEAIDKITTMIAEYLRDMIDETDAVHAEQLSKRRAANYFYVKYAWYWVLNILWLLRTDDVEMLHIIFKDKI